jgi:biotin carboxyl carrier protein
MQYRLVHSNEVYDVGIRKENDGFFVTIGDRVYEICELVMRENSMTFKIGGHRYSAHIAQDNDKRFIALEGEYYVVERSSHTSAAVTGAGLERENSITSPMPGLLVKLAVKVGDLVKEGDTLAIVEAMKMQNELRSPIDGRVEAINFKEGDQVDALQAIVEIEAEKP